MKNTFIDSTGKIQIVLAGNVTANQLQWTCSYYDKTLATNAIVEGEYSGVTNQTTAVDICTAPASGHTRVIKNITVYNADTATATVILQLVDGGGTRVLIRNSLTTLASRSADDMSFYTDISSKVDKSTYDANSILYATTDNTPVALTVGASTIVGRKASGDIVALTGAEALTITAGAPLASPTFTGTVTLPKTVLGEESFQLDPTLSANGKRSGITKTGTAGAQLTFGQVCYFATSGKWLPNDGILDGTDTGFSKKLGMCVLAASGDAEPTEMLEFGYIYATAFPTLTIGAAAYLSDTAGEIIVAQPTTTNFAIRVIGYGETADILLFNPSPDYIVHL